jgi:pyrroline-5-carboxylate reductase
MKVSIIGGGVMGEAIVARLLGQGLARADDIMLSDVLPERLQTLADTYGVGTSEDNRAAAAFGEVVVLAVKPQVLGAVLGGLKGSLRPSQLVLSIVAGARVETITKGLGHEAVVRAIPNTPAQIGQGMSVWTATKAVDGDQKERARSLLGALGREVYVEEERYIDMATAISGSGPAYVFLFLEAFIDAAVHIGFPRPLAQELALQTVLGSALYMERSGRHPAELRGMVTTPGGTTVEGLLALEEGGLRAALVRAAAAAYEKSQKLGGKSQ